MVSTETARIIELINVHVTLLIWRIVRVIFRVPSWTCKFYNLPHQGPKFYERKTILNMQIDIYNDKDEHNEFFLGNKIWYIWCRVISTLLYIYSLNYTSLLVAYTLPFGFYCLFLYDQMIMHRSLSACVDMIYHKHNEFKLWLQPSYCKYEISSNLSFWEKPHLAHWYMQLI